MGNFKFLFGFFLYSFFHFCMTTLLQLGVSFSAEFPAETPNTQQNGIGISLKAQRYM